MDRLKEGKVLCTNCDSKVIPRLWHHDTNSALYHRSIEHICPICGSTMYVTGGGKTLLGKIVFLIGGSVVFWFISAIFFQNLFDLSNASSGFLAWVCLGVALNYFHKSQYGVSLFNRLIAILNSIKAKISGQA